MCQYPSKDKKRLYYQEDFVGVDGVEKYYNTYCRADGSRLVEVDAGKFISFRRMWFVRRNPA